MNRQTLGKYPLPVQCKKARSGTVLQSGKLTLQKPGAGADTVLCAPFAQALQNVPGGAETYFAVLTRSHAFDLDCLTLILKSPQPMWA